MLKKLLVVACFATGTVCAACAMFGWRLPWWPSTAWWVLLIVAASNFGSAILLLTSKEV